MSAARRGTDDGPVGSADQDSGLAAPLRLEEGLGFRLSRVTRSLRADWAQQLAELTLTPPEAAVLRGVAGQPGCSLRALARVLGAEPMTSKRYVDGLEARGLLDSAHRGDDRRSRGLELTPAGALLAARVDALVQIQERRILAALGDEGHRCLDRSVTALEELLGLTSTSPQPGKDPGNPPPTRLSSSHGTDHLSIPNEEQP